MERTLEAEAARAGSGQKFGLAAIGGLKTITINNRRYLGNKYRLLPFIERTVAAECEDIHTVADIFSGTGAVSFAFSDKKVITNDIMYSNYICNLAWFGPEPYSAEKVAKLIAGYNRLKTEEENYMTVHFSDTYFSRGDCSKIGFIREDIEEKYRGKAINGRERAILIASLLYAMDRIANTCGHYDAYRKGVQFEKPLELALPLPGTVNNENNQCLNIDANQLVRRIEVDLVYIDPPYNSRQYCDAYHLLENVARWEKPKVYGVARKMDRTPLKSDYCTQAAPKAFEDLIENIRAKYILLSYNNMAGKGNDRSNAKISDEDILRILKKKGQVKVFSEEYRAFSAGKSDISGHEERLFLCRCEDYEKEVIQSPLNYTGGKFKLLPQLLPLFPRDITLFADLFCGGCNVGINVGCSRAVFSDVDENLIRLFQTFQRLDKEIVFRTIDEMIERYGLSRSSRDGYSFYGCDSSRGLSKYNRERYLRLREGFNARKEHDDTYYIMLYVLIIYCFNNQVRFNQTGQFNLPVGKRDFNTKMEHKLSKFIDRLKSGDYKFCHMDFRSMDLDKLEEGAFLYADPPYLITCATYNEQGGWGEKEERELLEFLNRAHRRGLRFALSNVLSSKGRTNQILLEWIEKNREIYRVIDLNYDYSNSSYHTKDRQSGAREVLLVNY